MYDRPVPIDPSFLPLLQGLPIGIVVVLALEGPWVFAILRGTLGPTKKIQAEADAAVTRAESERDRALADRAEWQAAWREEQKRGDTATTSLGAASVELGQVASKLIHTFATDTPTMGDNVLEAHAAPVSDGR